MMKQIILVITIIGAVLGLSAQSHAQGLFDDVCSKTPDATVCQDNQRPQTATDGNDINDIYGPDGILTKAARILAIAVGVASVIIIIVGGFQYVLSGGDATKINNAKNTIIYALIGLAIALLAQGIIVFVLNQL